MTNEDDDVLTFGALLLGGGAAGYALAHWLRPRESAPTSTPVAAPAPPTPVATPARNARRRPRATLRPRGAARSHPDVEFSDNRGEEHLFRTFDEAVAFAAGLALTTTVRIELDVLVTSRAGAVWWAGADGGKDFDEAPDASVFDRLLVKVTSQGRVP